MTEEVQKSGFVSDWQNGKTLPECNLHMLETEDFCDVIFRVGSDGHVIRAHRYVLASRSCVFHAMFCGPMAEQGEITVPDIEADVFKGFLRFLYSDNVDLTMENAPGILYTSRKYSVDALFTQCASFLENSLTEENVCEILEHLHCYREDDIVEKALKILRKSGEKTLKSPGFKKLCRQCLEKYLTSDGLRVKEEDVFEATIVWAKERCEEENLEPSPENQRKVLGNLLYQIRFPAFSLDYLITTVRESQILKAQERILLVDKTGNSQIDISPFVSKLRHDVYRYVKRFRTDVNSDDGYQCTGACDSVSFSTNKDILLIGIQLYGCACHSSTQYAVTVEFYDTNQLTSKPFKSSNVSLKGQRELNDVMFDEPISISPRRHYTMAVVLHGHPCSFGSDGVRFIETDGVMFHFTPSSLRKADFRTDERRGQIPGIIWCLQM